MSSGNLRAIYCPSYTFHSGESTAVLHTQLLIIKDLAAGGYCRFQGTGTRLPRQKPFRTFLPSPSPPKGEKNLIQGPQEFHGDQMHTSTRMLAFDPGCDRGCFWGDARTSRRRRSRNCKAN